MRFREVENRFNPERKRDDSNNTKTNKGKFDKEALRRYYELLDKASEEEDPKNESFDLLLKEAYNIGYNDAELDFYNESNNILTRGAYALAKIKNRLTSNSKEEESAKNRSSAATLGRLKAALNADSKHSELYGDNDFSTRGRIHNYQSEKRKLDSAKSHYDTMTNVEKRYRNLVKDIENRKKQPAKSGKKVATVPTLA